MTVVLVQGSIFARVSILTIIFRHTILVIDRCAGWIRLRALVSTIHGYSINFDGLSYDVET